MSEQIVERNKMSFFKRFYAPKEMFIKRKYKWWQNALFLISFALIAAMAAFIFLSRPNYYHRLVRSELAYFTEKTSDPQFQRAVNQGEFKNGKFIYHGKKLILKKDKFNLGINLNKKDMAKNKPRSGLVFASKNIVLYVQTANKKHYELSDLEIPYSPKFNPQSHNLKKEIETSWLKANTSAYLASLPINWLFGFVFRILLVWLIFILVIRSVIRKVNKKDETMTNLFGLMANASLIPIVIASLVGMFYFSSRLVMLVFVVILLIQVIRCWRQTKFSSQIISLKDEDEIKTRN